MLGYFVVSSVCFMTTTAAAVVVYIVANNVIALFHTTPLLYDTTNISWLRV